MAAHETIKGLISAKLPRRPSPDILALLDELSRHAQAYHDKVTVELRKLPADRQRAVREDPRFVQADKHVKGAMAQLKGLGVNLYGFNSTDFCEAFLEVYKTYRASR